MQRSVQSRGAVAPVCPLTGPPSSPSAAQRNAGNNRLSRTLEGQLLTGARDTFLREKRLRLAHRDLRARAVRPQLVVTAHRVGVRVSQPFLAAAHRAGGVRIAVGPRPRGAPRADGGRGVGLA